MVRIKHRYFLLNILYPDSTSAKVAPDVPEYLRFHAPTPQHVNAPILLAYLRSQITALYGDQGLGFCLSSLRLVYFSNATSTAILRVPRAHYQIVWATLSCMTEIPAPKDGLKVAPKCVVRVVRVSGTIRKAEEELLRRSRRQLVQAQLAGMEEHSLLTDRSVAADNDVTMLSSRDPASSLIDVMDESESE